MARPLKNGLGYFPLDVDIFEDDKLFDVQNEYGHLGEVVYIRLLCMIYKNGYYLKFDSLDKLSNKIIKSIGSRWFNKNKTVIDVIGAIVESGLFDKKFYQSNVLTSRGVQERYKNVTARRQLNMKEYLLVDISTDKAGYTQKYENVDNNAVNVCNNAVNVYNNEQKKSKENKIKRESQRGAERDNFNLEDYPLLADYAEQLADKMSTQNKRGYVLTCVKDWVKQGFTLEDVKLKIPIEKVYAFNLSPSRAKDMPRHEYTDEELNRLYCDPEDIC